MYKKIIFKAQDILNLWSLFMGFVLISKHDIDGYIAYMHVLSYIYTVLNELQGRTVLHLAAAKAYMIHQGGLSLE